MIHQTGCVSGRPFSFSSTTPSWAKDSSLRPGKSTISGHRTRSLDHIDIAECSSVLALSLAGPAVQSVKISKRREGPQEGPVFDPFAPWHLLSLQSFPDDEHTVRSEDDLPRRRFPSEPHAFLDALAAEYRDATRRNIAIHERITKLITPPTDFMFDPSLRDKLLFEDKRFTYIRRYFWAYNTLGVINAGLRAMLAAYADSFTDDFWAGRHSAVWPHPDPDGPDVIAWRETMAGLRTELERTPVTHEAIPNMAGHQNPDELLRAVEASHEQYLRSLRTLHDALASSVRQRSESRSTIPVSPLLRPASSPALSPQLLGDATFPSQSPGPRSRRPTLDPNERRPQFLSIERKHTPASLHSEYEVEFLPLLDPAAPQRGNGYAPAVPRPIERRSWTDGELMRHLKRTEFHGVAEVAIKDILDKQSDIDENGDFASFAAYEHEGFISSTLELYDIDADGLATPVGRQPNHQTPGLPQVITPSQIVDAPTVWNALKEIHSNGQAVGLMTTLQEPTPLMLEALHLTMSPYFDMTELLRHFTTDTENKGKTRAYVNRAFVKDDTPNRVRQRSAFFVFKYYTVVGEGLEPAAWQKYDKRPSDARSLDHIDIAECSSVLALSLAGPAVQSVKISKRREGPQEGPVFDPFAPWHLLSLQSFPDDEHTVRSEDDLPRRRFPSGPHAFLDALAAEYRDATRRNIAIHERITKLITPPTDFMFDPSDAVRRLLESIDDGREEVVSNLRQHRQTRLNDSLNLGVLGGLLARNALG
ncbi:hypothetical protein BN1723_001156 [Verticillium longisporum]|uniref:Uncharacterized protein n=1 Tax=Verticillium longisporum TaxID=100787 RepID=A0A0G4NHF5_VERLO|nr:hypothetical protein BN1723_001156 [Verticillium longisporum]